MVEVGILEFGKWLTWIVSRVIIYSRIELGLLKVDT